MDISIFLENTITEGKVNVRRDYRVGAITREFKKHNEKFKVDGYKITFDISLYREHKKDDKFIKERFERILKRMYSDFDKTITTKLTSDKFIVEIGEPITESNDLKPKDAKDINEPTFKKNEMLGESESIDVNSLYKKAKKDIKIIEKELNVTDLKIDTLWSGVHGLVAECKWSGSQFYPIIDLKGFKSISKLKTVREFHFIQDEEKTVHIYLKHESEV